MFRIMVESRERRSFWSYSPLKENPIGRPLKEALQRFETDGHQKGGEEHPEGRLGFIPQGILRKKNHEDINGKGDNQEHGINEGPFEDDLDVKQAVANDGIGDKTAHNDGQDLAEPVEGENAESREDQVGDHSEICRDECAEEDVANLHPADSGGIEILLAQNNEGPAEIGDDKDEINRISGPENNLFFAGGGVNHGSWMTISGSRVSPRIPNAGTRGSR
ncbi:MAG: hypothetical protein MPW15_13560 [Candidatus Manganitrophus sp.]|nr:hypothetical protein [Candidatus Manganitrophus sp.]